MDEQQPDDEGEVLNASDTETDPAAGGDFSADSETVLMALDQISQTIEVMNSVVGRLRHYVEEQGAGREAEIRDAMRPGRILH